MALGGDRLFLTGGTGSGASVVWNHREVPKPTPKQHCFPLKTFSCVFFFLNKAHTLGRQSHMQCDKVGNYVSLSAHQGTNAREPVCVHLCVWAVGRLAGAGPGADHSLCPLLPALKGNQAVRLISMWGRVWPSSPVLLSGFHGNVCLWKILSMLATDTCFWSLSLLVLLEDERFFPLFHQCRR